LLGLETLAGKIATDAIPSLFSVGKDSSLLSTIYDPYNTKKTPFLSPVISWPTTGQTTQQNYANPPPPLSFNIDNPE
jgi:hypothetical protein